MSCLSDFTAAMAAVELVSNHFHVSLEAIEGHCREWRFVWPRWIAINLVRSNTSYSLPQIGLLFGRHHVTIIKAIRGLEDQVATHPDSAEEWALLKEQFARGLNDQAYT